MGANGGVPSGTVVRVAEVLKAVGAWGAEGARLIDLTSVTGLPRPTTHRILHELIDANLVRQSADRRYSLSPTALFMGTSVLEPFDNLPAIRDVVQDLAETTTVTTYLGVLMQRRVVYIARGQGSAPVHIQSVMVGQTRPLTSTNAGVALLSCLPGRVQEQELAQARPTNQTAHGIVDRIAEIAGCMTDIKNNGYFYRQDLTITGVSGMAALTPQVAGVPPMAITITALNDYLTPERATTFADHLFAAARAVGDYAAGL